MMRGAGSRTGVRDGGETRHRGLSEPVTQGGEFPDGYDRKRLSWMS